MSGAIVVGAVVLLGAAQQGGRAPSDKPGSDSSIPGPPPVTDSGADTSIKGPPPQNGASGSVPRGTGYSNPGGAVDPSALEAAAASGGVHYHVHYHGTPGQAPNAGYAGTSYINPANLPSGGTASQYMPGYGPGNPGPLGSAAGNESEPFVGSHTYTGFSGYGAAGNYFGGPGGYFGGGGGLLAPSGMAASAAYSEHGFVAGFND